MKGTVKILDRTGHTTLAYDTERPEGYTDGDLVYESTEVVEERIKRELAMGSKPFALDEKRRGEQVKDLKLGEHESVLIVPPLQGG